MFCLINLLIISVSKNELLYFFCKYYLGRSRFVLRLPTESSSEGELEEEDGKMILEDNIFLNFKITNL